MGYVLYIIWVMWYDRLYKLTADNKVASMFNPHFYPTKINFPFLIYASLRNELTINKYSAICYSPNEFQTLKYNIYVYVYTVCMYIYCTYILYIYCIYHYCIIIWETLINNYIKSLLMQLRTMIIVQKDRSSLYFSWENLNKSGLF